ncbi:MAG: response regulator, partial [Candidatus Ventricola sp.]|nr:response regulator [Candidatus Ventricola sp.]
MAVKGKVLIVEDDRAISNFIRRVLEANGYEALMVHTGREANSMISSHCPDLVILDLGLPDMDGLEVLRSLRRWSLMPVVVVSA